MSQYLFFFFFKQKTAYEIGVRLVGSEMCIRDRTTGVSTQEQNETRQLAAMRGFGVEGKNIVVEKMSGKDFRHP